MIAASACAFASACARPGWRREPLHVSVDLEHGGRCTSLRTPTREWLWTHPDPDTARSRSRVQPGDAFVDAGGIEECLPTVNGTPDHGDVWSRPWRTADGVATVATPSLGLSRRITTTDGVVLVDYVVSGAPGTPFHHAVHALLDVGPDATWQARGTPRPTTPNPSTLPIERLGPDDGTAVGVVLEGTARVEVTDGDHSLVLTWETALAPDLDLRSMVLWRNLRGWPEHAPYRSIGFEPLIGRHPDLAIGLELEAADPRVRVPRIGADSTFGWRLRAEACVDVARGA